MTRDECLKALDDLGYRYASQYGDDEDAWPQDAIDSHAAESRTLLASIDGRATVSTVEVVDASNALRAIRIYGRPAHGLPSNVDSSEIDLSRVQAAWERQLTALLGTWKGITADQIREIADRVRAAVNNNDVAALAALSVSTQEASAALILAMNTMAQHAAEEVVREARTQGAHLEPVPGQPGLIAAVAIATATLLGSGLANAGAREALRRFTPGASGDAVSAATVEHLKSLSDAFLRDNLGNALTSAQNDARMETYRAGPVTALYGNEVMDGRTCKPCRRIDGKWLGNTDDPHTVEVVNMVYPNGGYVECEGGPRCRGTIVGVYRPRQVDTDHALPG